MEQPKKLSGYIAGYGLQRREDWRGKPHLQKAYKAIYKQLPSLQRELLWRKHGDGLPVQKPHSDNTLPPGPPKVQKPVDH
ncbi:hypothetical protein OS493_005121 [Desmophyllum pertusum]|uniref:Uncharacterized protein n=1 Tax=Desmophyllum pertusum TaxID=174260 RepID=A0A9X0CSU0_9CNID|nr:hypothetical protein OS493_005121 [Desmophyllum pertusum]